MSDSDTPTPSTPSADRPGHTHPYGPSQQAEGQGAWHPNPWSGGGGANGASRGPGPAGTHTLPRYDSGGYDPGGYDPGGYGPGGGTTPPPGSTWAPVPPGPPPRRRAPVALIAGVLVGALVVGGVGGYVGYEAASSQSSGTSALSGPSSSSGSSAAATPGSVEAVAQKVLPSVVQLKGPSGEGSGIVVSSDGLILTNAHVLEAGRSQEADSPFGDLLPQRQSPTGTQLQAVFQNGQAVPVQVVGTDTTADLAVVRAQGATGLTPVTLGDSSRLQVGQGVVAVGSPLGLSGTVTSGIVSALQRPVTAGGAQSGQDTVTSAIQTDAAINPGNSGGALTDLNGRVVGITSSIASLGSGGGGGSGQQSGSIGLGFAIPIDQAKRIGDELATQGFANQAVLGVGIAQSGSGAGSSSGSDDSGAVLGTVDPGGAGGGAGLRPGDVVTKLNDRVIDDGDALVAAVRAQPPGAQVTLTVSSNGSPPRPVPVTLGTERAPSS